MSTSKADILIVDDTLPNLHLLREMLKDQGYRTRGVRDGASALRAAHANPPDLILLDIRMPGLTGYEVCEELKADARTREIPVIFISAADEVWDKIRAFEVGGVDYVTKPFQSQEVLARVKNQLALHRLQQDLRAANAVLAEQKAQIEAQAQRLMELDAVKSRFFANISHEFRAPLTLMLGRLEDVLAGRHGALDAEAAGELGNVRHDTHRLNHLIDQILDLSRLEAGVMPLKVRQADLAALLDNLRLAFASLAERKQITFTLAASPEPVLLYFDPDALVKVFTNLLSNAFKFTPVGGRVDIRLTHEAGPEGGGFVRVAVQDSGPGISEETLPHVFERYYQGHDGDTRLQAGTGIGLALSRELVHFHHGHVEVESTVGSGSTFTVTLPLGRAHFRVDQLVEPEGGLDESTPAPQEAQYDLFRTARQVASSDKQAYVAAAQARDQALAAEAEAEDRTTVLIVDDNPEIRVYVRRHLAPAYRVVEAANGVEGLARARQTLPDLIVSDVKMPEMDGYAFCRALKQDPELDFIPIILLTVEDSQESRLEGLQEGVDDYMTKPFEIAELQARVRNLIASRQQLRERFAREAAASPPEDERVLSADERFLQHAREVIGAHLADSTFGVEQLATALAMERSTLYRRLRALVDQSAVDYIRSVRLEHAAHLLSGRAGSISEIAYGVGFKSLSHFSASFSKQYDVTPSAYMRVPRPTETTKL